MMFCPKCKSLLFPIDGIPTCRRCGYQSDSENACAKIVSKGRERDFMVVEKAADTLPTAVVECPKCGNKKAYWVLRQTRAADEPETRIFRCTRCSHSWREY